MYDKYIEDKNSIDEENKEIINQNTILLKNYEDEMKLWRARKENYDTKKQKINDRVEQIKEAYNNGEKYGIEFYFNEIIKNKKYSNSKFYKKEFELEYNDSNNILLINYRLPKKVIYLTLKK
ncbi:MAG TPA: hypothetical protein DG753_04910 [Clostridium sp.]|nr:hypothetical protein [Clostridium sp.]